jgi:catechol 2,3-dioxygenase-like lactoylglutathione lyase family enzyme
MRTKKLKLWLSHARNRSVRLPGPYSACEPLIDESGLRDHHFLAMRSPLHTIAAALLIGLYASAQSTPAGLNGLVRPPIVGVAHIALRTDNLAAARHFYSAVLGFQEAFHVDNAKGRLLFTGFKINEHQYIEISPDLSNPQQDRLVHIAFETSDVDELRTYLAVHGVSVPESVAGLADGNRGFDVVDPDGHEVEFVQYIPGSLATMNFGKFLSHSRISQRMIHLGVVVSDRRAADRFYKDVLGFREIWSGGSEDNRTDWVDMRVPEGTDWLEYMLNVHDPAPRLLGVVHHLALGVPSVQAGYEQILKRKMKPEEHPHIGRDGKWQLNLYDPNRTRVELMEPKPVQKPCCSPMRE